MENELFTKKLIGTVRLMILWSKFLAQRSPSYISWDLECLISCSSITLSPVANSTTSSITREIASTAAPLSLKLRPVFVSLVVGYHLMTLTRWVGPPTFLHTFAQNVTARMYKEVISDPANENLKSWMEHYAALGHPGCMGSVGCTVYCILYDLYYIH